MSIVSVLVNFRCISVSWREKISHIAIPTFEYTGAVILKTEKVLHHIMTLK